MFFSVLIYMVDYFKKYRKYKLKYLNLKEMEGGKSLKCYRYIVFSGSQYYPAGGWDDFVAMTETLNEAKQIYKDLLKYDEWTWAHIIDMKNKKNILKGGPEHNFGPSREN